MITYQKAIELEKAGFPQQRFNFDKNECPDDAPNDIPPNQWAYCPTLAELIDACGPKFWALEWVTNKRWVAHSFAAKLTVESLPDRSIGGIRAEGRDAETAVANLFLALRAPGKKSTVDEMPLP